MGIFFENKRWVYCAKERHFGGKEEIEKQEK